MQKPWWEHVLWYSRDLDMTSPCAPCKANAAGRGAKTGLLLPDGWQWSCKLSPQQVVFVEVGEAGMLHPVPVVLAIVVQHCPSMSLEAQIDVFLI